MKIHRLFAQMTICCVFGLTQSAAYSQGRTLTATQLDSVVKTDLDSCTQQTTALKSGRTDPETIIPSSNARTFPTSRIAKTLNGVWRGRVLGDDKDVSVDYFWIIDTKRNEAIIVAQRTGKSTLPEPVVAETTPKLTFLMCAHEGYIPSKDTPQLHEFVKVDNSIADATKILREATGKKIGNTKSTLSQLWRELVATGYFTSMPAVAYAGGFFRPLRILPVENAIGPASMSLKWDAVYRGGGATSIKFKEGVPIIGVEHVEFVGTSATRGDFLVSSPGNGKLWKVEARIGASYDLAFDKVTLGPLQ